MVGKAALENSEELHDSQGVQDGGSLHLIFCSHFLHSLHSESLSFCNLEREAYDMI